MPDAAHGQRAKWIADDCFTASKRRTIYIMEAGGTTTASIYIYLSKGCSSAYTRGTVRMVMPC